MKAKDDHKMEEKLKHFKFVPKIKQDNVLSVKQIEANREETEVDQNALDIGKFKHYSKSNFVNFCRFVLDSEKHM